MNKTSSNSGAKGGWALRLFCFLAATLFLTGCHVLPPMPNTVQDMGPRYKPTNVYRKASVLPAHIRRVAMLPLSTATSSIFLKAGVESLSPLVYGELEKTKRFEIIPVSPEQLRQWTGKNEWRSDDALPADFFQQVAESTGCDAVLFCQLTRCEPYQPVAVGWKFSLVANPPPGTATSLDLKDKILWAADEVIDAGEPGVANAARDYYAQHLRNEAPASDPTTILTSPTRFGQYTLATLLETLPARGLPDTSKGTKVSWDTSR